MWPKIFIYSFVIGAVISEQLDDNEFYIAGAVEYGNPLPTDEINFSSERFILGNLYEYKKFIKMAKENNVDILVFPEATLNYFAKKELNIQNSIELPNPNDKIAPYQHNQYSNILRNLSKYCKDNQIYVLVNLVEKVRCNIDNSEMCKRNQSVNLYNTNVIFDRHGRVISKYQKYNLFMEADMEIPDTAQHSTFVTDFNVKFGSFICFDILFKEPALNLLKSENITNVLYSSMWYSEMPFLTSIQLQSGWAYANNINLISSGANNPHLGSSGTGIYLGRNSNIHKLVTGKDSKYLIIAKVPKDPNNYVAKKFELLSEKSSNNLPQHFNPIEMQPLKITEIWSNFVNMKWDINEALNKTQKLCSHNNEICCKFDLKVKYFDVPSDKIGYKYKLVVNSTIRAYGDERMASELYCAIVSCTSNDSNSCGTLFKNNKKYMNSVEFESIKITALIPNFNDVDDLLLMPTTLNTSIAPLDTKQFSFDKKDVSLENGIFYYKYVIESKEKLQNLLTFGILGRNFPFDYKTVK